MKKQTIDEHRSIEIISQMIADTSATIDRESGKYFLVWGYTTVVVSLFEYFAQIAQLNMNICLWAWFLIPIIGGIGTLLLGRNNNPRSTRPKSYLDRSISAVWLVIGCSYGLVYVAALVYHANILFLTVMLMGIGTVITGKICQHKVLTIAGKLGIILSLIFPAQHLLIEKYGLVLHDGTMQYANAILYSEIAIFALIFIIMMVVPGHILYNRARQNKDA